MLLCIRGEAEAEPVRVWQGWQGDDDDDAKVAGKGKTQVKSKAMNVAAVSSRKKKPFEHTL